MKMYEHYAWPYHMYEGDTYPCGTTFTSGYTMSDGRQGYYIPDVNHVTCPACLRSKKFREANLHFEIAYDGNNNAWWADCEARKIPTVDRRVVMANKIDFSDTRIAAIEVTPMWAGDLAITDVDEALKMHNIPDDLLPKAPSRAASMRRAFEECSPRGAKIDMLPKGLGVAMSLKDVGALDLEQVMQATGAREAASYHATLTAKIIVVNTQGTEVETLNFTPDDHPMVALVREVYRVKREQYKASEDLSVWFSQTIIPAVGGVGKRSRGGVYYVPASRRELILQIASALELVSSSHTIDREVAGVKCPIQRLATGGKLCVEARTASDTAAVEIMVDNVIRQTDTALDDLASALEPQEGKRPLGKRGLSTKKEDCARLEGEIAAWESVCSTSLDLLRNRLEEVKAAIGVAELAAEVADAQQ